jgi:hypothetical protein
MNNHRIKQQSYRPKVNRLCTQNLFYVDCLAAAVLDKIATVVHCISKGRHEAHVKKQCATAEVFHKASRPSPLQVSKPEKKVRPVIHPNGHVTKNMHRII